MSTKHTVSSKIITTLALVSITMLSPSCTKTQAEQKGSQSKGSTTGYSTGLHRLGLRIGLWTSTTRKVLQIIHPRFELADGTIENIYEDLLMESELKACAKAKFDALNSKEENGLSRHGVEESLKTDLDAIDRLNEGIFTTIPWETPCANSVIENSRFNQGYADKLSCLEAALKKIKDKTQGNDDTQAHIDLAEDFLSAASDAYYVLQEGSKKDNICASTFYAALDILDSGIHHTAAIIKLAEKRFLQK